MRTLRFGNGLPTLSLIACLVGQAGQASAGAVTLACEDPAFRGFLDADGIRISGTLETPSTGWTATRIGSRLEDDVLVLVYDLVAPAIGQAVMSRMPLSVEEPDTQARPERVAIEIRDQLGAFGSRRPDGRRITCWPEP